MTGEIISDADLAVIAKAINSAETPHRDQSPPGLSLVLFAKLDKESAVAARKALAKVKGVSRKETRANVKKGQISVKISGEAKISTATILTALKDAGIEASISQAKE